MIFWNGDDKDNDNASCSDGDGNVEDVEDAWHQMWDVRWRTDWEWILEVTGNRITQ